MTGPKDVVARGVAFSRDHTFAARRRRGPGLPGLGVLPWRSGDGESPSEGEAGSTADADTDTPAGVDPRDLLGAVGHALLTAAPFLGSYLLTVAAYRALPLYAAAGAVIVFGLLSAPFYVGGSRGRRDYSAFRRLEESGSEPTPEDAAAAFDCLDARQRAIRLEAVRTIAPVCRDGPGAFLDQIPVDAETVATRFVRRLQIESDDRALQRDLATLVEWFSRDYGRALRQHGKRLRALLERSEPAVAAQLALTLGNVGATASGSPAGYVKALTPAVESEDASVRRAAAVALGKLDCDRARRYLHVLTEDDDSAVRERAEQSVRTLGG